MAAASVDPPGLAADGAFFVVAAAFTAVHIWFQTHGTPTVYRSAGFAERLLGAGGIVWFYLYKAILPLNLAFIYPQWHIQTGNLLWWLPLLAALTVTAVLWRYRQNGSRPILLAWLFFCVSLLPVMGFADAGFMEHSLVANHYQHIALLGVIALAAAGWSLWRKKIRMWLDSCGLEAKGTLPFLLKQKLGQSLLHAATGGGLGRRRECCSC